MNPERPAWHASIDVLERYADLDLDVARSASIEQHLLNCASCRAQLSALTFATDAPAAELDALWLEVIDTVDRPRAGVIRAVLSRLGFSDRVAMIVAATPALRLSWIASILVAVTFGIAGAVNPRGDEVLLLVLAPLVPLLGIGTSYGAGVDPLHELTRAAPVPGSRVFLFRALAVLGTALPLTLASSMLLPFDGWTAIGWLLPALGLAGVALALSTVTEPRVAAGITALGWTMALTFAWLRTAPSDGVRLASTLPFRPAGQLAFAAVAVVGAAVFWSRLSQFDHPDDMHVEVQR